MHAARHDRGTVGRLGHFQRQRGVEACGETAGEVRRQMLDDDDAGCVGGHGGEDLADRLDPAGGSADGHDVEMAEARRIAGHCGRRCGCGPGRRHAAHARGGRRLDLRADLELQRVEGFAQALRGLGDVVDGPQLQCAKRGVGTILGQRRDHHDRHGPHAHQPFEELDAVHARHLHVERQHVGIERLDLLARDDRVGRGAHDLEVGVARQDAGQHLAHECRIVDDEDARRPTSGGRGGIRS